MLTTLCGIRELCSITDKYHCNWMMWDKHFACWGKLCCSCSLLWSNQPTFQHSCLHRNHRAVLILVGVISCEKSRLVPCSLACLRGKYLKFRALKWLETLVISTIIVKQYITFPPVLILSVQTYVLNRSTLNPFLCKYYTNYSKQQYCLSQASHPPPRLLLFHLG